MSISKSIKHIKSLIAKIIKYYEDYIVFSYFYSFFRKYIGTSVCSKINFYYSLFSKLVSVLILRYSDLSGPYFQN